MRLHLLATVKTAHYFQRKMLTPQGAVAFADSIGVPGHRNHSAHFLANLASKKFGQSSAVLLADRVKESIFHLH